MTAGVPAGAPICCSQYSPGSSPFMQLKRVPSAVRTTTCPLPFGPIIEPLSGTSLDLNSVRTDDPFACNHQNANKTGFPSEATGLFFKFPISFAGCPGLPVPYKTNGCPSLLSRGTLACGAG